MKHHSELIQHLIRLRNLESYLEIGVFNRDHNFNKINCLIKCCVDPDKNAQADFVGTSDDFFDGFKELGLVNHKVRRHIHTFGLVFIDGLHHADQVKKDFENALSVLDDNGFIVMHDCNPHTEQTTCIPRGRQREWTGDVYKFASTLGEYDGIDFVTSIEDYGCACVWKSKNKIGSPIGEVTWQRFEKEKTKLLNLMPFNELIKYIEK